MKLIFSMVRMALVASLILMVPDAAPGAAEPLNWSRLQQGTAQDISINADGQAYAIGLDGTPWRWDRVEQRWRRMSGSFRRISAAEGNRPWAVDAEGAVRRYNGLWWETKDSDVADVAADAAGNVFIAKTDGSIRKWNPLRSEWLPVNGNARRIALDGKGLPWVVTTAGIIQAFDGREWTTLPGRAFDIALGGDNTAVIADADGRVRMFNRNGPRWEVVPGVKDIVAVALTPDGGPWALTADGAIMITRPLVSDADQTEDQGAKDIKAPVATAQTVTAPASAASAIAAPVITPPPVSATPVVASPPVMPKPQQNTTRPETVDAAAITTTETITFVDTRKSAASIAIGKDGSVFGLDVGGKVLRWSNARQTFDSFPGSLVRIAVDAEGKPWGISALGRIFRHDGASWRQIIGAVGADISIGAAGTVMITDASGALYLLNDASTAFARVSGNGAFIAVGPDNVPWTIRDDKLVQRCDTSPCTVLPQKAHSIDIGPDGSVWIVSDRNLLMRLKDDGKNFETIPIRGHTPSKVAAGPNGYPWVVTNAGRVLSSRYFERDETGDLKFAAGTSGGTVGSGLTAAVAGSQTSGVTFSKNMRFETVSSDVFSSGGGVDMISGRDGNIWAEVSNTLAYYNKATRRFVAAESAILSAGDSFYNFAVSREGDVWAYVSTYTQTVALYRERNGQIKEYTVSGYTPGGVAVAPDDTVYAIFYTGGNYYVYRKPAASETFTRLGNDGNPREVAVGPGNDVWIVSGDTNVYQWTGTSFAKRPFKGQTASSIDVGMDGTVYIQGTNNKLYKWNTANGSFDVVNNITVNDIAVDEDGRPWIAVDNTPTIKRARD